MIQDRLKQYLEYIGMTPASFKRKIGFGNATISRAIKKALPI